VKPPGRVESPPHRAIILRHSQQISIQAPCGLATPAATSQVESTSITASHAPKNHHFTGSRRRLRKSFL
jgi:hypothetical protein